MTSASPGESRGPSSLAWPWNRQPLASRSRPGRPDRRPPPPRRGMSNRSGRPSTFGPANHSRKKSSRDGPGAHADRPCRRPLHGTRGNSRQGPTRKVPLSITTETSELSRKLRLLMESDLLFFGSSAANSDPFFQWRSLPPARQGFKKHATPDILWGFMLTASYGHSTIVCMSCESDTPGREHPSPAARGRAGANRDSPS